MAAHAIALMEHDRRGEFVRWGVAGAIVLAAHAGIMATYLALHSMQPQGAPEAPAVIIDLAPMPVAPASPMDIAPGPEMVQSQPPPDVLEPPPETLVETPPLETIVEPPPPEPIVEPPPPQPILEVPVVAMPEPPPPPPPPPEVKPDPKPEPKSEPPPEPVKVERKKPAPRTAAAPRSERRTAETPSAPSPGSVNSSAAIASWRDTVVSQLQRAKRYPGGAESRREQGVVTLSFTLSRAGGVLSRGIARSSGNSELDQEVLAMVQRAAPFPAFPASMPQSSVHLVVPVRFSLR